MSDIEAKKAAQSVGAKYDDLPYLSKAFYHVSPEHLRANAKLFGMNPAKLENARVLDLGCGTGNNLLKFALDFPKADIIGVELSKKEVDEGSKWIKDLGLKNYDLKCASILDIDESYGKFDYILCHGVFSWVPKEVQDKILEVMDKNLNTEGVAFVSYNCLPGWNAINGFRHMLQFHSRYFDTIEEKVSQSKALLNFVGESLRDSKTPYSGFLERECQIISSSDDSFLYHEYIEKGNTEFYFSDFIDLARSNNLDYLADTSLSSMSVANLPPKAAEKLSTIPDIIRQEQYMDFVIDRRFRNTLLCKKGTQINRNLSSENLRDFYLMLNVVPHAPIEEVDFSAKSMNLKFNIGPNNLECTISSPVTAAAFYALASSNGKTMSLDDIKSFVSANCKKVKISAEDESLLLNEFLSLVAKGLMNYRADKPTNISVITDKPKASDLAIYQAKSGLPYATSGSNESVALDVVFRHILSNLNGKNNLEDLTKILDKFLTDSGQSIEVDGKRVTDDKLKFRILGEMVSKTLHFSARCGFLVG